MNKNMQKYIEKLAKFLLKPKDTLIWRHSVGNLVARILTHDRSKTYGRRLMDRLMDQLKELLPERLRTNSRMLYQAQEFAKTYSATDLKLLNGANWSQVRCVLALPDVADQHAFLVQAREENWNARQMAAAVHRHRLANGGKSNRLWADTLQTIRTMQHASLKCRQLLERRAATLEKLVDQLGPDGRTSAEIKPLKAELNRLTGAAKGTHTVLNCSAMPRRRIT